MSDKQTAPVLTAGQQGYLFEVKANLLAGLILQQQPSKQEAKALAETVNAAFAKLTA